jgi:branched-chain amino acid transport system substrate-binding protein
MEEGMKTLYGMAIAGAFLCFSVVSPAQQPPIQIASIVELSGVGATPGTAFDNGAKLAVKEVNAAGGILGRQVELTSFDDQSNPSLAKGLVQKAADMGAYAIVGPSQSGMSLAVMQESRRLEIRRSSEGKRLPSPSRAIRTCFATRSRS